MPSLKDLRIRIKSVKSTQKITAAMKMVAAAKLRRAQEHAEAARPYADRMNRMMTSVAASMVGRPSAPPMLVGTGKRDVHLVLVATGDRGLCGGFNSSIVRDARALIRQLQAEGKTVKVVTVGRKGRDQLRRGFGGLLVEHFQDMDKPRMSYAKAVPVAELLTRMYTAGEFDVCTLIYNRFRSAISQVVTRRQLIPFELPEDASAAPEGSGDAARAVYEAEPSEEEVLAEMLPRNLGVQIYRALLENYASEQGARMTAMDNATRNAGEMIEKLTMNYNRTRQAMITKELIEIISGAEAI